MVIQIRYGLGRGVVVARGVNRALQSIDGGARARCHSVAQAALEGGACQDRDRVGLAIFDPKCVVAVIHAHCLRFQGARLGGVAHDIGTHHIWTATRDEQMWSAFQG